MMSWFFYPLPPVIPVGFVNEHISYLRINFLEGAESAVVRIRIRARQGQSMPLPNEPKSRHASADGSTMETTYRLEGDCDALDGGSLELAGFSYNDRNFPTAASRLQFDSKLKLAVRYAPF